MPVQVFWDDEEKTVIRQVYIGDVDTDVYIEVADLNLALQAEVDHPVDVIIDVREGNVVTTRGIMSMIEIAKEKTSPNQRVTVNVGLSKVIKNLINMVRSLMPPSIRNVFFAETVEEAREIIRNFREKIGEPSPKWFHD